MILSNIFYKTLLMNGSLKQSHKKHQLTGRICYKYKPLLMKLFLFLLVLYLIHLFIHIISYPPFYPYQVVPKIIGVYIIRWLHPITVAYWFMGDKGKESNRLLFSGPRFIKEKSWTFTITKGFGYWGSKGIELHSQGFDYASNQILAFDYASNQILAEALTLKNGWKVDLKPERDNPYQHKIVISPKSFDSFI